MKILMLADSMGRGGTERRLTELLKGLKDDQRLSLALVVFSSKIEFTELDQLGIPVHILERKSKKDPRPFLKLFNLCKQYKPDIIHSWGSMATIYALPTRWFQPVLLVNAIITDAPNFRSAYDQRLLRFRVTAPSSDLILANCQAGLLAYKAPKGKSAYIFNGFDFSRLSNKRSPDETRKKYGIQEKKIIGMVGAFAPRKDYQTFLKIAHQILSTRNDVVFVAVGGGEMIEECKNQVKKIDKGNIVFTGATNNVEEIVQLFSIGILISNKAVHGEGISNAIMEYMAAGKPVIANNNGGNAEIIVDGETGFIIDEADNETWLRKIHYLLDHSAQASQMGELGQQRIRSTFSIQKMVTSFTEMYQDLYKKRGNHA
jgi:glycosyltransferase involved in cell wall biosynthesis